MACVTITITQPAYERLKKRKESGDSFSDVILREVPPACDTAGEVLDSLVAQPAPKANPTLRAALLSGRGRRSPRSK